MTSSTRNIKVRNETRKKLRDPFNYVRLFFQFGGIFVTKRYQLVGSKRNPSFWKAVNAVILLCVVCMSATVIITVYAHFFTDKYDSRLSVMFIFFTLLGCMHRIYLSTVFDGWFLLPKKIFSLIRKLHLQVHFTNLSWIILWATSNTIINFVALILIVDAYATPGSILFLTFEVKSANSAFVEIFPKLLSIVGFFLLFLPTICSALYYALICQQVKITIEGFIKFLKLQNCSYQRLANAYNEIRDVAHLVDDGIRFYAFISAIYYAIMMFMGITLFLHPGAYLNQLGSLSVSLACFMSLVNFLVMTFCASSVHEASVLVKQEANRMQEEDIESSIAHLKFLHNCDLEIAMTVWGFMNINKNFIFGFLGTLFTYCILIDNLHTEN